MGVPSVWEVHSYLASSGEGCGRIMSVPRHEGCHFPREWITSLWHSVSCILTLSMSVVVGPQELPIIIIECYNNNYKKARAYPMTGLSRLSSCEE